MIMTYSGSINCYNILYSLKINFDITYNCNFKCSYCSQHRKEYKFVTIEQYDIFLNNLYDNFFYYDYLDICFNGGECFTHPHIAYFTNKIIDKFPQLKKVCFLTNGSVKNIDQILLKINTQYIDKILFITSFHETQISFEHFIQHINTYYHILKNNTIRIMVDLLYDDISIILKKYFFMKEKFPLWDICLKFIKHENTYHLYNVENVENIIQYTNFILYSKECKIYSPESFLIYEDRNFCYNICKANLFINVDGFYSDRLCSQKTYDINHNIFIPNSKIYIYDVICNQKKCLKECDLQASKYSLEEYGNLLKKQSR